MKSDKNLGPTKKIPILLDNKYFIKYGQISNRVTSNGLTNKAKDQKIILAALSLLHNFVEEEVNKSGDSFINIDDLLSKTGVLNDKMG